ncbi:MAG: Bug family tripartite tricarboxylate transporter substrate binding protein [Thermodesulfobacteriota bacterium]
MRKQRVCLFFLFLLFSSLIGTSNLLAAPYYQGKVITLIVGFSAGGGYDRMFRLVARHLPNHIPGKPTVIVDNMPGGDSITATNHLYNVAKPDGLTIGGVSKTLPFVQLLKVGGMKFDLTKFAWLCSASVDSSLFYIRNDLPYKSMQDLQKAEKTIFVAGQGPTAFGTQYSLMLMNFLKLNAKLVDYGGTPETILALERKETDAAVFAYNSGKPYVDRGLVRPLLRTSVSQKGIEHIPVDVDLVSEKMGKTVVSMLASVNRMGKPLIAPPGTPAEVVKTLRDAFAKTINDPGFLADAEKSKMDVEYVRPEDCLKALQYVFNQPADVVKEFGKFVKF